MLLTVLLLNPPCPSFVEGGEPKGGIKRWGFFLSSPPFEKENEIYLFCFILLFFFSFVKGFTPGTL
jgi:hypothetical protein